MNTKADANGSPGAGIEEPERIKLPAADHASVYTDDPIAPELDASVDWRKQKGFKGSQVSEA